ncbi:MAG: hypothetical protein RMK29_21815 [Myxococcales bacterium]|nr:hypothetical protein [Myxococcales bacterium]
MRRATPAQAPLERPGPLVAIQRGLESLYRIETHVDISDFLLTAEQQAQLSPNRRPPEQLLLHEHADGLDLALYLEASLLRTLTQHDPREGINGRNLPALLLVIEGVSHFVYAVDRARNRRSLSALELELQAEVDKYVVLVLLLWKQGAPGELIDLLFRQVAYRPDLSPEERTRYAAANAAALCYAEALHRRYLRAQALLGFLTDVRRFWRLSLSGKLSHINIGL